MGKDSKELTTGSGTSGFINNTNQEEKTYSRDPKAGLHTEGECVNRPLSWVQRAGGRRWCRWGSWKVRLDRYRCAQSFGVHTR